MIYDLESLFVIFINYFSAVYDKVDLFVQSVNLIIFIHFFQINYYSSKVNIFLLFILNSFRFSFSKKLSSILIPIVFFKYYLFQNFIFGSIVLVFTSLDFCNFIWDFNLVGLIITGSSFYFNLIACFELLAKGLV